MKQFFLIIFAATFMSGCQEKAPAAYTETSPAGITYTRLYMPEAESVAIQIAWPTDWATRENVNQAIPYIGVDLILAGGAEGYPAGEVTETFADLKAEAHLSVTPDNVLGQLTVPKENLAKAVEIAGAHLRAPTLDQGWFDRIQQGFAANMAEAAAGPAFKGFAAIRWAVLGDVPLRRALSVDPLNIISAATREELTQWHKQTLFRTDASIVIAGTLDANAAGAAVDALIAGLPIGPAPKLVAPKPDFSPRRILLHAPDAKTSTLTFIAPLPPTREGHEFEDVILANALGGDDQSVLFNAVRTELRASYGFGAGLDGYSRELRLLAFTGEVETSKLAKAETTVRAAYEKFRQKGLSDEIQARKAPLVLNAGNTAKDPNAASFSALMALLDGQNPSTALHLQGLLEKVDAATVGNRLTTAFPPSDAFLVMAVTPDPTALSNACIITAPAEAVNCK